MTSVWLCPSRGRPSNISRLLSGWRSTQAVSDLVVRIDDDDPTVDQYLALENSDEHPYFRVEVGPRLRLGPTLNEVAPRLAKSYDAVGFLGDDHLPRTPLWDEALEFAVSGGGIAYANDLLQGAALPTAVLMSSDIILELGQFCPPDQVHLYLDNYWLDLGTALGRIVYLPDVTLEHLHFSTGKSEQDALYAEVNSEKMYSEDSKAYQEYLATKFQSDVERVKAIW